MRRSIRTRGTLPFRERKSAQEVGNIIIVALNVSKFGTIFFDKEASSQNTLCIEVGISESFMVSKNGKISTVKHSAKLAEYFHDRQQFFLDCGIVALCGVEFAEKNKRRAGWPA